MKSEGRMRVVKKLILFIISTGLLMSVLLYYNAIKPEPTLSVQPKTTPLQTIVQNKVYLHSDQVEFESHQQNDDNSDDKNYMQRVLNQRLRLMQEMEKKTHLKEKTISKAPTSFLALDPSFDYLIHSAHYDPTEKMVKMVGFGPISDNHTHLETLTCIVENKSNKTGVGSVSVYYRISTFVPWQNQRYDSYIFHCNTSVTNPSHLSIHSTHNLIKMPIYANEKTTPKSYKFAVCVSPLVNNFSDVRSIKHFIAANTMFGAQHFYFHISDASQEVERLLRSVSIVTVHEWRLGEFLGQTHAYGQKASYAHCLLKYRRSTEYMVFIDIDEVLVPRNSKNWMSMVEKVNQLNPKQGAIVFQSKLFLKSLKSCATPEICEKALWSLGALDSVGVFPLYQWSKVLVHTERIDIVDIHKVRRMLPDYEIVNADPSTGLVHHYRSYDTDSSTQVQKDDYMKQHERPLLDAYNELFPLHS